VVALLLGPEHPLEDRVDVLPLMVEVVIGLDLLVRQLGAHVLVGLEQPEAEGGRLGVDAVRAPDRRRKLMRMGAASKASTSAIRMSAACISCTLKQV
jgi:hypothetical protein